VICVVGGDYVVKEDERKLVIKPSHGTEEERNPQGIDLCFTQVSPRRNDSILRMEPYTDT
jgi:hypothetical protein